MRRHVCRARWPVLLALATAIALFAAPSALASTTSRMQQLPPLGAQPLDQLSGDAFDQAFLAQMTMHHAMGVMMTRPVVASGAHQELKDLGAGMIADQSREIEQMRGWLQGWYGQDVTCPMVEAAMPGAAPGWMPGQPGTRPMQPGTMMPGMGGMMPGMGGMMPGMGGGMMPGGPMVGMPMMGGWASQSPEQLDAAFMMSMIAHHQGAIDMAALAEERAAHQEVKDLADSIITSQSAEIETMRGWLADWYGR
jgi:uncharacterized protein (DUF305 family)